jgi:hypothetical protein
MASTGARSRIWARTSRRLRRPRASLPRPCHLRVRFLRFQRLAAPFASHSRTRSIIEERALALAMHRPDFAAHINEMKSAPRQFAHSDDIAAMHSRPGVGRRVFDLMTVSHVEMLHKCLRVHCRQARPPLITAFAALHNYMLLCTIRWPEPELHALPLPHACPHPRCEITPHRKKRDALRHSPASGIRMSSAIEIHYAANFDFRKEIVAKFVCHRYP